MLHRMEEVFPTLRTRTDPEGRKRWVLATARCATWMTLTPEELAALDVAAALARRTERRGGGADPAQGQDPGAGAARPASRLETDHEALLDAQGFVARPGPRPKATQGRRGRRRRRSRPAASSRSNTVCDAGRRPCRASCPGGLLAGIRRYLVVRSVNRPHDAPCCAPSTASPPRALTDARASARDESFDLAAFARRSFGAFQSPEEYGEVVWRFTPEAADTARDFVFHPDQVPTGEPDGSLTVRFTAWPSRNGLPHVGRPRRGAAPAALRDRAAHRPHRPAMPGPAQASPAVLTPKELRPSSS
ncbi:MAG: WYL domain-containing protein [Alphaproteobacteria bacterium]